MKQTLLSIRRNTDITTQAIAQKAGLPVSDVYTVEVGGCASWALAQKVVSAFNQLSGLKVSVYDIEFSRMDSWQQNAASPGTIGGNPQTSQH